MQPAALQGFDHHNADDLALWDCDSGAPFHRQTLATKTSASCRTCPGRPGSTHLHAMTEDVGPNNDSTVRVAFNKLVPSQGVAARGWQRPADGGEETFGLPARTKSALGLMRCGNCEWE